MKKEPDTLKEKNLMLADHLPSEGMGRDEMKQLYLWSSNEAMAAHEAWVKAQAPNTNARGPFFRWAGAQELMELCDRFKQGENVILKALLVCATYSLPQPYWLECAFIKAYRSVHNFKAKNWDDVFGSVHPKGTHLETKKEYLEKSFSVYKKIEEIKQKNPETPIDAALFEAVGRETGLGSKTKIENMYYKEKKFFERYKR